MKKLDIVQVAVSAPPGKPEVVYAVTSDGRLLMGKWSIRRILEWKEITPEEKDLR